MAHTIRAAQKPTNGKRKCSVMNRKKNRIKPELEYAKDSFLNNPVASATECTFICVETSSSQALFRR